MHTWGDEDFDWEALDAAMDYIVTNCLRYARFRPHVKEKWGTMRVSLLCSFWGEWPIHDLIKPGYFSYRWPKWVRTNIDMPLSKVFLFLGITKLIQKYQLAVLKYFWKRAAKKWPHIKEELMIDYEWVIK